MRCGTIVFRNADGSPGSSLDFVAGDDTDMAEAEPADEIINWLLEEFLEHKKQSAGNTEQSRLQ